MRYTTGSDVVWAPSPGDACGEPLSGGWHRRLAAMCRATVLAGCLAIAVLLVLRGQAYYVDVHATSAYGFTADANPLVIPLMCLLTALVVTLTGLAAALRRPQV